MSNIRVQGIPAQRKEGAIIYDKAPNEKRMNAQHINNQDKYTKSLEKRIVRLENLVNKIIKEQ